MKYQKKPIIVDAEPFVPEMPSYLWPSGVERDPDSPTGYGIFTLEDTQRKHEVTPGDWIITGIAGERYPCEDTIFRETYEQVE